MSIEKELLEIDGVVEIKFTASTVVLYTDYESGTPRPKINDVVVEGKKVVGDDYVVGTMRA